MRSTLVVAWPTIIAFAVMVAAGAATAGATVTVGVLSDMSGLYADTAGPGSVEAVKMAVEDFANENKGLDVHVVSADHQNKPDVGANIARQWYDKDGVDMIIDVPTSSVALAVSEVTREKNKTFIDTGAATSDLTGKSCSPNTVHWTYDTVELANGTGGELVRQGGDTWFFLTADYAFGHALERDTTKVIEANGGKVLGHAIHPFPGNDFSSYLLQAQASGAKVIGLANAGGDTVNSIKQAAEFGIAEGGQRLAGLLIHLSDIHALGLNIAQGLVLTQSFYWDLDEGTRSFAKRFAERTGGRYPTMNHAGAYAGTLHYLKAVAALGDAEDGKAVVDKMKELPTDDPLFGKGMIRKNGRKIHDAYLFQVKTPAESKAPYDYLKLLATIPGDQAFGPLSESACPLVQ